MKSEAVLHDADKLSVVMTAAARDRSWCLSLDGELWTGSLDIVMGAMMVS